MKDETIDITQQISELRRQLTKNYSELCNARDFLSTLSLNDIGANFLRHNADVISEQQINDLASGNNIDDTEYHVNEMLQQKTNPLPILSTSDDPNENCLKLFLTTIGELQNNVKNLQNNHLTISKLNDKIYESMANDTQRITSIQKELQQTATVDAMKSAEKLIKLEMSLINSDSDAE